jgi:transcriptional regulator with XRE-family HTH domain
MIRRNIIGKRVRLARERAKPLITQADLAARLQVEGLRLERVTISKIETGYREVTDVEALAIAKVLGVTVSWLIGEIEDTKGR